VKCASDRVTNIDCARQFVLFSEGSIFAPHAIEDGIMSTRAETLFDAALELSEADRLSLAAELIESVPQPPELSDFDDPAFLEEVRRRVAENDPGIPWEQVKAELLADLAEVHGT
jgi:hypothetical protein